MGVEVVVIGEVGVGGRGEGVESLQAKEKRAGVPEGETETWHRPDGAEQQRAPEGENTGRSAQRTSSSPALPRLVLLITLYQQTSSRFGQTYATAARWLQFFLRPPSSLCRRLTVC